jgi:hypothetical protein
MQSTQRPSAPDDWEIEISQLHIDSKVAAGSFSNLYKGFYCGQEVAVKILKDLQDDASQYQEFLQEVSIMRKVRYANGAGLTICFVCCKALHLSLLLGQLGAPSDALCAPGPP